MKESLEATVGKVKKQCKYLVHSEFLRNLAAQNVKHVRIWQK